MRCSLYFSFIEILLAHQLFIVTNAKPLKGHISSANPRKYPFIASLGMKSLDLSTPRDHFCTGVLISKSHVLTVEHCLENRRPSDVDVIIGKINLKKANYKYNVRSWITFDDWSYENRKPIELETNDVAIVTLSETVNEPGIVPVVLTKLNITQLQGTNAIILGWGETNGGRFPNVLQKAKVKILTNEVSEKRLHLISKEDFKVPKNSLVTAADAYALVDCGDSGGPLLNGNNELLGITRGRCPAAIYWGPLSEKFLNDNEINVHSSIDFYREFIVDVARNNFVCRVEQRVKIIYR